MSRKFKVASSIYSAQGLTHSYRSVDFYVRLNGKDVKFPSKRMAKSIAMALSDAELIEKHTTYRINSKREREDYEVREIKINLFR